MAVGGSDKGIVTIWGITETKNSSTGNLTDPCFRKNSWSRHPQLLIDASLFQKKYLASNMESQYSEPIVKYML